MTPFGAGNDGSRRAVMFSALGCTGSVAKGEACLSAVRCGAGLSTQCRMHDPTEHTGNQLAVGIDRSVLLANLHQFFGKQQTPFVAFLFVVAVFADPVQKFQSLGFTSGKISSYHLQDLIHGILFLLIDQPVNDRQRVNQVCHAHKTGHDPVVTGAAPFDIQAIGKAIIYEAGQQRIQRIIPPDNAAVIKVIKMFFHLAIQLSKVSIHQLIHSVIGSFQHIQQNSGEIMIGTGNPDVGRCHRRDLNTGAVNIVMGFLFRNVIVAQTCGNNIFVENCRMGCAGGQDFASPAQVFFRHFPGVAQTHGGIHQTIIRNDFHAHHGQFIKHRFSGAGSTTDHIAAGQAVGNPVIDLNAQAIQQSLGKFICQDAFLLVCQIVRVQIPVRSSQLKLLPAPPHGIIGQYKTNKVNRLYRFMEAFCRIPGDTGAILCNLMQFCFPDRIRTFFSQVSSMPGIAVREVCHCMQTRRTGIIECRLLRCDLPRSFLGNVFQHTGHTFVQKKLKINRHVRILSNHGAYFICPGQQFFPTALGFLVQENARLSDDQFSFINYRLLLGKGCRISIYVPCFNGLIHMLQITLPESQPKRIIADHRLDGLIPQHFDSRFVLIRQHG